MGRRFSYAFAALCFSLCGTAVAAENFIGNLLDTPGWMDGLKQTATDNYAPGMKRLSLLLVGVGIMVTLVRVLAFNDDALDGILRFVAVTAVLASTVLINNLAYSTWDTLREAAVDTIQPQMNSAADELDQLAADSTWLLMVAGAPSTIAMSATRSAQEVATLGAAKTAQNLKRWLNLAVLPVFFFILLTYGIIIISGMALVFASILLPVSAAMIMLSAEAGEKWMSTYIQFTAGSLLTVALMPIAFGAAFDLAIVQPIATVNENFSRSQEIGAAYDTVEAPERVGQLNDEIAALYAEQQQIQEQANKEGVAAEKDPRWYDRILNVGQSIKDKTAEVGRVISEWDTNTLTFLNNKVYDVLYAIRNWLTRLALLLILGGIGSYIILVSSSSITGLIGGASLAVARQMARPMSALGSKGFSPSGALGGGGGSGGGAHRELGGGGGSGGALGSGTQGGAIPSGPGAKAPTPQSSASAAPASKSTPAPTPAPRTDKA